MSKRKNKQLPALCSVSWCVLDVCLLEPKAPDCAKAAILAWLPSSPGAPAALAGRSSYKDVAVASVSGFLQMFSWWPLMTLCSSSSIIQLYPVFSSSSSGRGGSKLHLRATQDRAQREQHAADVHKHALPSGTGSAALPPAQSPAPTA